MDLDDLCLDGVPEVETHLSVDDGIAGCYLAQDEQLADLGVHDDVGDDLDDGAAMSEPGDDHDDQTANESDVADNVYHGISIEEEDEKAVDDNEDQEMHDIDVKLEPAVDEHATNAVVEEGQHESDDSSDDSSGSISSSSGERSSSTSQQKTVEKKRKRSKSPIVFDETAPPTLQKSASSSSSTSKKVKLVRDDSRLKFFFEHSRFFLIKSGNSENVSLSKAKGVWATTPRNEHTLNKAFRTTKNVILCFSVEKSQAFQGFCRIAAESTRDCSPISWVLPAQMNPRSLGGIFKVHWINRNELPFVQTSQLLNSWNENKPVKIGRDGTEIAPSTGKELCSLFTVDDGIDLDKLKAKVKKLQEQHPHRYSERHRYSEMRRSRPEGQSSSSYSDRRNSDNVAHGGRGPPASRPQRTSNHEPMSHGSGHHGYAGGLSYSREQGTVNGYQTYYDYVRDYYTSYPTMPASYFPVPQLYPADYYSAAPMTDPYAQAQAQAYSVQPEAPGHSESGSRRSHKDRKYDRDVDRFLSKSGSSSNKGGGQKSSKRTSSNSDKKKAPSTRRRRSSRSRSSEDGVAAIARSRMKENKTHKHRKRSSSRH